MATPKFDYIVADLRPLAIPLGKIRPDPANARAHDERNVEAVAASLARFGQQKPVVVDAAGVVIAGNATLEAARRLGWTHLAVVRSHLLGPDRTAYAIADNRTAELATWDTKTLPRLLAELDGDALAATGFTADETQAVLDQLKAIEAAEGGGLTDPDDVPLPGDKPITRHGDLWVLGDHRVLCGNASLAGDVDRLLDGAAVHMVNTDPPYNVKLEPRSNNAIAAGLSSFSRREDLQCAQSKSKRGAQDRRGLSRRLDSRAESHHGLMHHQSVDVARQGAKKRTTNKMRPKDRPLANDFVTDEAFKEMLLAWFGNMARVLRPGRCFYIWGGYANCGNYPPALKACELYFAQAIIWVKEHPVLTRKDFMGNHEWCFYGWRLGAGHKFFGPPNATDVWSIKKVNPASMIHLTEKPVELAGRAIGFSSMPNENVLDLFGGSGSTLIACQQTGRRCYMMELDELYTDVIVKRWENFTGKKASRVKV